MVLLEASPHAGRPQRMRILLSSFACSPLWGSEPGVGWRWLNELVRDYDVTLLTHAYFKSHLEGELAKLNAPGLTVIYADAPNFGMKPERYLNSRVYYVWWQWRLRAVVRPLLAERRHDVVHHLTWGTFRFPCFLGRIGVPLVMGPLGGGEAAPLRLMRSLPWRERVFDAVRKVTLLAARFDPLATWGPKRSTLVLCKTSETLALLPVAVQDRAFVCAEVGSPEVDLSARQARSRGNDASVFRLLFAGRLIGWKGVSLAIGTVGCLRKQGVDVFLDIAGEGGLRSFLEDKVEALGLSSHVKFHGSLSRRDLFDLYGRADVFLFPSLHDSSGNVVLESLSRGLPVVCLDLGGPKHYVDASCGAIVGTLGLSEAEVEQALADVVADLASDIPRLDQMAQGAALQAARLTWSNQVQLVYAKIAQVLGWQSVAAGRQP